MLYGKYAEKTTLNADELGAHESLLFVMSWNGRGLCAVISRTAAAQGGCGALLPNERDDPGCARETCLVAAAQAFFFDRREAKGVSTGQWARARWSLADF
jgi:hypothetical protein